MRMALVRRGGIVWRVCVRILTGDEIGDEQKSWRCKVVW
jgi:hypothetical protein